MGNNLYPPEKIAREGYLCDCGNPAVDYHNGFRCERCRRLETTPVKELDWREKARRERLSQGLPEYHVLVRGFA